MGTKRETERDLIFPNKRIAKRSNGDLSAVVRQHQKQHQKWISSILITTDSIEAVAFGSLLTEGRGGKQKCVSPPPRKIQRHLNARVPHSPFASRTVPPAHPHNPRIIKVYNLTCNEMFSCFIAAEAEDEY